MNDPDPSAPKLRPILPPMTPPEPEAPYRRNKLLLGPPKRLHLRSYDRLLPHMFASLFGVGLLVLCWLAIFYYSFLHSKYQRISYEELKTYIEADQVEAITVSGADILLHHRARGVVQSNISAEQWAQVWPDLQRRGIAVSVTNQRGTWAWVLGTLTLVGIGYILLRYFELWLRRLLARPKPASANDRFFLGKSNRVTFKNLVLPPQVLAEFQRLVRFITEPHRLQAIGGQFQRGLLLIGPSGVGKTLAASALAGEARVPFLRLEPGSSLPNLQEFFELGRKNSPCVLFIDNIDLMARSRSMWPDPEMLNLEAMTTALISALDGDYHSEGVLVVAATNRPDLIDEALVRPGRLSVIEFSYPGLHEVEGIFKIYSRKIPLSEDVDIAELTRRLIDICPQCTGAVIAETCSLAATLAANKSLKLVNQDLFLEAMEQVCKSQQVMGKERSA